MRTIKGLTRLLVLLASLGASALGWASSASASTTVVPLGGSGGSPAPAPATVVHTLVVGGMPGWQIALIAVAAALVTAVAAVLADRTRATRRRLPRTAYPIVTD
jgi:ABC-type enterobactin transport system permease subunit